MTIDVVVTEAQTLAVERGKQGRRKIVGGESRPLKVNVVFVPTAFRMA